MAGEVWRRGRFRGQPDEGHGGREPQAEADVCGPEYVERFAEGSPRQKLDRPSFARQGQRRKMAENAVAQRETSIALACRAFGVSETCYGYGPTLRAENEQIASDPLVVCM